MNILHWIVKTTNYFPNQDELLAYDPVWIQEYAFHLRLIESKKQGQKRQAVDKSRTQ